MRLDRIALADIVTELAAIVGANRIVTGSTVGERVTSFWNSAPMQAKVMVYPQTTEEVSDVLRCLLKGDDVVYT